MADIAIAILFVKIFKLKLLSAEWFFSNLQIFLVGTHRRQPQYKIEL